MRVCKFGKSKIFKSEIKEIANFAKALNKYIRPLLHSTKLLLMGDYIEPYNRIGDELFCGDITIEEAIECVKKEVGPNTLFKWEDLNSIKEDDFGVMLLDLDNIPELWK